MNPDELLPSLPPRGSKAAQARKNAASKKTQHSLVAELSVAAPLSEAAAFAQRSTGQDYLNFLPERSPFASETFSDPDPDMHSRADVEEAYSSSPSSPLTDHTLEFENEPQASAQPHEASSSNSSTPLSFTPSKSKDREQDKEPQKEHGKDGNAQSKKQNKKPTASGLPFALAKFFSYVSLLLILVSSFFLALFVGNTMRASLLDSQEDYALLLAQNLNKQIFRRFTLPVAYASGRVSLSDPDQYRLLDEVVTSLLHGLRIETIRIYDDSYAVTYSTDRTEVTRTDLYTPGIPAVFQGSPNHFDVLSAVPYVQALIMPNLDDRTFQLRTVFPLSIDLELAPVSAENTILGALEIIQDVTSHYKIAIRSQWLIMGSFALSSLVLFILFQVLARKAERILAERMVRNRQLESELHQSEKLASMGRMVASIAHEIRNPLGIIRSSAEFLLSRSRAQKNTADPQANRSEPILEAIYDEACRLGSTVTDFLDYARPRSPKQDSVNLVPLLNKALVFLGGEFDRQGVQVHLDIPENMPFHGDAEFLYRAFYNILVNAQQAIAGQGDLYLSGAVLPDGTLTLSFHDSGPGFPKGAAEKALDPFFTTKDSGTGLGLPIVNSIITAHGGSMELGNAPEGGALVRIVFPSSAPELDS